MICSENGNEHGNVYDQRTGFGSDDIDYPPEPSSKCKRLMNLTLTTYIHKTIPPHPKSHQPLLSLPFFLQLTTNKNPTTDDPKYPAPNVNTADALQNACANVVGIAYGCLGILGVCRMRPMIWVAPPSLGSIQILMT